MTTKIVIPAIALGVMLVAVGFAIQPIQEATAVHTTIQANTFRNFALTGTVGPDADAGVLEAARWTINQPFNLVGVTAVNTVDTNNDCNLAASNIRTDLVPEAGITEVDPAIANALNDVRVLMNRAAASTETVGTTVLEVGTVEEATCEAGDRIAITAIIETTGALTAAPAATIAAVSGAKANGLAGD
jgi:hypothetical protein